MLGKCRRQQKAAAKLPVMTWRHLTYIATASLVAACSVSLKLPTNSQVSCRSTRDCASGQRCVESVKRCVALDQNDSEPPRLQTQTEAALVLRNIEDARFRFSVSEELIAAPIIRILGTSIQGLASFETPTSLVVTFAPQVAREPLADGPYQVLADTIERFGNQATLLIGELVVDRSAPVIDLARLQVAHAPPRFADSVTGLSGATEALASVELYRDEGLSELLSTAVADASGGFFPISLGDNSLDQSVGQLLGQDRYYLRATDRAGNDSQVVPLDMALSVPTLSQLSLEQFGKDHLGGGEAWQVATRALSSDRLRVRFVLDQEVAKLPQLTIRLQDKSRRVGCALLDVDSLLYECLADLSGSIVEGAVDFSLSVESTIGSNVLQQNIPNIVIDLTRPSAPDADKLVVHQNARGTADSLTLLPGAVEPFAKVAVVQIFQAIPSCFMSTRTLTEADAEGAVESISLGDNELSSFYVVQVDSANLTSCTNCAFDCDAIQLYNDTYPPTISAHAVLGAYTPSNHAVLAISGQDQAPGSVAPSETVSLACTLDDGTKQTCLPRTDLANVSSGRHSLKIEATDALNNTSDAQAVSWFVRPALNIRPTSGLASPSQRSVLTDSFGRAHVFMGGRSLSHFYEDEHADLQQEIVDAVPVEAVRVTIGDDDTLYAVYLAADANQSLGLFAAVNAGAGWNKYLLAAGAALATGFDVAWADTSARVVWHQCLVGNDCIYNGPNYRRYAVWTATLSASGLVEVTKLTSLGERVTVLRLSHGPGRELAFERIAGQRTIHFAPFVGGTFSTAEQLNAGSSISGTSPQHSLELAVLGNGDRVFLYSANEIAPLTIGYKEGQTYNFIATNAYAPASLAEADGRVVVATANEAPRVRLSNGTWQNSPTVLPTANVGSLSFHPTSIGSAGELSGFWLGADRTREDALEQAYTLSSVHPTLPAVNRGLVSTPTSLAASPSLVVLEQDRTLVTRGFANGVLSDEVELDDSSYGGAALTVGSQHFVATFAGLGQAVVKLYRYSGSAWTSLPSLDPGAVGYFTDLRLTQTSQGPLLTFVAGGRLWASLYNGTEFPPLVDLLGANNVGAYALIGDSNGATAGGDTYLWWRNNQLSAWMQSVFTLPSLTATESALSDFGSVTDVLAVEHQTAFATTGGGLKLHVLSGSSFSTTALESDSRLFDWNGVTYVPSDTPNCAPASSITRLYAARSDGNGGLHVAGGWSGSCFAHTQLVYARFDGTSFRVYPLMQPAAEFGSRAAFLGEASDTPPTLIFADRGSHAVWQWHNPLQ